MKVEVHILRLAGKDYYDAVVNIDKISAVLIQVRGVKVPTWK